MTSNAFLTKLRRLSSFDDADIELIGKCCGARRIVPKHEIFLQEGITTGDTYVLLEGMACHFKEPSPRFRQITALLVAGDFCNIAVPDLPLDHSVGAMSQLVVAILTPEQVSELSERPAIMTALKKATAIERATARAWLFNVGKRKAHERSASLLLELHCRLLAVGRAQSDKFELPLTQLEWSDALGLSLVHTNKSLQTLRKAGGLEWRNATVRIADAASFAETHNIDLSYLNPLLGRVEATAAECCPTSPEISSTV